jgi:hypothetical protein
MAAGCCFDGAVAIQAFEARARGDGSPVAMLGLLRKPRWLAGTALAIAGWPLQIAALAVAPLAVVQPALACGLVLLLVLGVRMLGEPARPFDFAATAGVAAGLALLVWGAGTDHPAHTRPAAIAIAALGAVAVLPWLVRMPGAMLIACAGAGYAASAVGTKLLADASLLWVLPTAAVAGLALLDEMLALRVRGAARVAAGAFALQTAIPVLLEPVLTGVGWHRPAAAVVGLILVVASGLVLGTATAAARVIER